MLKQMHMYNNNKKVSLVTKLLAITTNLKKGYK